MGIAVLLMPVLLIASAWYYRHSHRPPLTEDWVRIQPGLHYKGWELRSRSGRLNRVMALRVQLDDPGIQVIHRPYSPRARDRGRHFILSYADVIIRDHPEYSGIINATRYHIDTLCDNIPSAPVKPLESVLVEGELSHRHPHSYLIWWTRSGDLQVETSKPPPVPLPDGAWMGVGVQGLQIQDEKPHYHTLTSLEAIHSRSFLGVDPEKNILWLIAFEAINGRDMIDAAVELGIPYGGQLDSGNATNMILGKNVPGVNDYTGIRNLRPSAGYLAVILSEEAPRSTQQTSSTASTPEE